MSYLTLGWAWEQPTQGSKKLLLLALADQANDDHECFPSIATLTTRVGVSRARVFAMLKELEAEGLIAREERTRPNGSRTSNLYRLAVMTPVQPAGPPPSSPQDGGPSSVQDGQNPQKEPVVEEEQHLSADADPFADRIKQVWAYWQSKRPSRRSLSDGASKQIRRALKAGYTVEDLAAMIDALLASDWHRERKLQYLSTILATKPGGPTFEDQLDQWLERAGRGRQGVPSASNAKVSQAKRNVLAAWEFPGDERVVERGHVAADWLAQHGFKIEHDDTNGKPRFVREDAA